MHTTSSDYNRILRLYHFKQPKLIINSVEYTDEKIHSVDVDGKVFSENIPMVGCCVSRKFDSVIDIPTVSIPKMAKIELFVRLVNEADHTDVSEWIPKGTYYIDTRKQDDDAETLTITAYDAMMKAEQDFDIDLLNWPATDIDVIEASAEALGISVRSDTYDIINKGYQINAPTNYSVREVWGYIAAMYAGNFIVDDNEELQIIRLNDLPTETNLLITEFGEHIKFGGDRILV